MGVFGRFTDTNNNCSACPGTLGAGMGDINDNGAITPSVPIAGNVSVPDLYSRPLVTLTLGTQTLQIAFYVFSSGVGVCRRRGLRRLQSAAGGIRQFQTSPEPIATVS